MALSNDTFSFDGEPVEYRAGDSLLTALVRAGRSFGGCLCLGGDCPHCVATVDGVSYVRTCQVPAAAGTVVVSHPADGEPPLPSEPAGDEAPIRYLHCDVTVIGGGDSGRAAAAAAR